MRLYFDMTSKAKNTSFEAKEKKTKQRYEFLTLLINECLL